MQKIKNLTFHALQYCYILWNNYVDLIKFIYCEFKIIYIVRRKKTF